MNAKPVLIALVVVFGLTAQMVTAEFTFGEPTNLGPIVNSSHGEGSPAISGDELELFFNSNRPGGFGGLDLWVVTRPTKYSKWGKPVNLGPIVNSSANEVAATISTDGLELYFSDYGVQRPGGHGKSDLWVTRRPTKNSDWGEPANLGPIVNSSVDDICPQISANGLELYFETDRPGGLGSDDIWVARRTTKNGEWGTPIWLGPDINSSAMEHCPNPSSDGLTLFFDCTPLGERIGDLMVTWRSSVHDDWGKAVNLGHVASDHWASSISADGTTLYFASARPGGSGGNDVWQVSISRDGSPVSR